MSEPAHELGFSKEVLPYVILLDFVRFDDLDGNLYVWDQW